MKISDIRATTITVPLEAPLRHANGCHWGRFVRTIVEVETDEGIIGLGEMGGGGESAENTFRAMKAIYSGTIR
jgi:glucarate dehydratase